jgi:tRNA threonylcarbamoyladenosine biosynthesis protein TsaE
VTAAVRTLELVTDGEEATRALARTLAGRLRGGEVIALDGPLGAGKTTFVRGLAEGLGVDAGEVSSPTFVLCHEYGADLPLRLIHVDAYRLSDPEELETFGFDELLAAPDAVTVVEWASRIEAALPPERIVVALGHVGPDQRSVAITAPPELLDALEAVDGHRLKTCPGCGEPVEADGEHFPFCSQRCRLVDLGRWFQGTYRVSRPLWEPDEDDA